MIVVQRWRSTENFSSSLSLRFNRGSQLRYDWSSLQPLELVGSMEWARRREAASLFCRGTVNQPLEVERSPRRSRCNSSNKGVRVDGEIFFIANNFESLPKNERKDRQILGGTLKYAVMTYRVIAILTTASNTIPSSCDEVNYYQSMKSLEALTWNPWVYLCE